MKRFHIQARQTWESFNYKGQAYLLTHLNAHEVIFKGVTGDFKFVVTYGLHCFAKGEQEHSIELEYLDSNESRPINLERYHLSKHIRVFIENLHNRKLLFETAKDKYFTFEHAIDLDGKNVKCKVCICIFKENRLSRIHVTSAFFDRENKEPNNKSFSIFKLATDLKKRPNNGGIPKEASRK